MHIIIKNKIATESFYPIKLFKLSLSTNSFFAISFDTTSAYSVIKSIAEILLWWCGVVFHLYISLKQNISLTFHSCNNNSLHTASTNCKKIYIFFLDIIYLDVRILIKETYITFMFMCFFFLNDHINTYKLASLPANVCS